MDEKITYISDKFQKIHKKVSEISQSDEINSEVSEQHKTQRSVSTKSNITSESTGDNLSFKTTLKMLKKIKSNREEQDRVIEQLKHIIKIQDTIYKADHQSMEASIRDIALKNIENFVNDEHKKSTKNMELDWVNQISQISLSIP